MPASPASSSAPRVDVDRQYGATYQDRIRGIVPGYNDLATMILAELAGRLGEEARVLVVGCGAGEELAVMAPRRPGWRFTAVDPSAQMVGIARERMEALGAADAVTFHVGTADQLPPGPPHDAATLALVMHFLPDDGGKRALLHSIAARLGPGAPLALVDAFTVADCAAGEARFESWMRYLRFRGMSEEDYREYRARVQASCDLISAERLAALLDEAGFGPPAQFYQGLEFGGWTALRR